MQTVETSFVKYLKKKKPIRKETQMAKIIQKVTRIHCEFRKLKLKQSNMYLTHPENEGRW